MKRFSEQLHKQSQTVKLKKSEQADLRARLVSYMEYHPLPAAMKTAEVAHNKNGIKSTKSAILTESFAQYSVPFQSIFKFGSVAAVFVLLVVPFMAERTVPGDTLYAVKVQFNEEVRSSLTWGSYEKVEWETERLNRRIAEARLLADEGLLTPEAEAGVAAAVQEHSDNAKREIEVLRASDADEAAIATIAFDSSLEVQAQALQTMPAIGGGEAAIDAMMSGGAISDVIGKSLEKPLDEAVPAVPAYGKLMTRIELNTTRVRELRDSLEGVVASQAQADVTRRIDDIDRAITAAVALAQTAETDLEARIALVDVLTRTQKLIVFMTELEVREQVAIESVVPVVLTDSEMSAERTKRMNTLSSAVTQLQAAVPTIEDGSVAEKVADTLTRLEQSQSELGAVEQYKLFIKQSDDVLALASEALRLAGMDASTPARPVIELPIDSASTTATTTDEEVVDSESATTTDEVIEDEESAEDSIATSTAETELEIDTI